MLLKMHDHGAYLNSRLLGRALFSEIENEVKISKTITLDFLNVDGITLSFGTELFDNIKSVNPDIKIDIYNANNFVTQIIKFCLNNIKPKAVA